MWKGMKAESMGTVLGVEIVWYTRNMEWFGE